MITKVLQVIPYSYLIHSGGLEKIAQTLSEGLNQSGIIIVKNVASDIAQAGKKKEEESDTNIFFPSFEIIHNFPCPKFRSPLFRKYIQICKQWKPNVIITHTRFFIQSMMGGIRAKLWGCKRIHIEHGSGFVLGYPRYIRICAWIFDRTIGLWIFRQCDQIVAISQANKQFIKKFTNKDPVVIYNPINLIPQEKVKDTIPHIGFVGRLVPLKGVDLLIQALKSLEDKERICTIVGTGPEDKKLQQLTHNLGLDQRITFVGADDRINWLHKIDIFVNPSYQEGLPTTVVEALIAKCIVVATDVGGTREISDQKDLILCKAGDIEDIKKKILTAYDNIDRPRISYNIVKEIFGNKKAIEKYISTISSHMRTS